ncbi:uncharacterized protein SOCE26_050460 [Sorangium cellulosum]|uniref:[acyl-carrier-protein] S-malonyltransferase n=1 Tax=Sorangium cellulosum TaxID=56 RepID=A0A2L0EWC6_SORCE|nr:ACP S-malonyltransferase [Sorangium cellulosum]AUX43596.1 uncharacterized protein SOCE26_050460 [Sorangium cellulosum]
MNSRLIGGLKDSPWFFRVVARPDAPVRLFCFPYAGKGASVYMHWAEALPGVDVVPIQLPGRENRIKERPAELLSPLAEEIVGAMAPLLDRPFAVFGHSMGSLLAFEVVRRVRARYRQEPLHLFVSGRGAPHLPPRSADLHRLPDAEFAAAIQSTYGGIPDVIRGDPELLRMFLPALRADLGMLHSYAFEPGPKLSCPTSVFGGDRDPHARVDELRAWEELVEGPFRLRMFEGDHFFVNSQRAALVRAIAAELDPVVRGGESRPSAAAGADTQEARQTRTVFVFPGQGSQARGMGKAHFDAFPRQVAEAEEILGYSLRRLCLEDPARELSQTQYTQPAVFVVSALAYLARLDGGGALPDAVAGHSLGEYTALFAAGVFDFATGVRLVRRRGELMSQAEGGGMAAVIGLPIDAIRLALEGAGLGRLEAVNLNSPRQTVLAGALEDIQQAGPVLTAAKARYVQLKVSAAFHSRYMEQAQRDFAAFVAGFRFARPRIPVIANCTARPYPDDEAGIRDLLVRQITSPVRWYETISYLLASPGVAFEEIGPGNVLTRLITEIREEPLPIDASARGATPRDVAPPSAPHASSPRDVAVAPPPAPHASSPRDVAVAPPPAPHASSPRDVAVAPPPAPRPSLPRDGIVFLYTGQGSQYFGMGAGLYEDDPTFRAVIDRCSTLAAPHIGGSLADILYRAPKPFAAFDRLLHTNPALFAVGCALTRALEVHGVRPDAVLGYGVGEYAAAVAAGALSLDDGLALSIEQARLLDERARSGAMLAVFDSPEIIARHPSVFSGCELAGVSFQRHFVISGPAPQIAEATRSLKALGIVTFPLPIHHALHSSLMDDIEIPFRRFAGRLALRPPRVAIFSPAAGSFLPEVTTDTLWRACRAPAAFSSAIDALEAHRVRRYVDVGPSGTLASFIKHKLGDGSRTVTLLTRFGADPRSVEATAKDLSSRAPTPGHSPDTSFRGRGEHRL